MCPPSCVCTMELRTMLRSACSSRSGSPRTTGLTALPVTTRSAECSRARSDLVDEGSGLQRLEVARGALEPGEREQLVEEARHSERLVLDHAKGFGGVHLAERAAPKQLHVTAHDRHRRSQLVACVGDEASLVLVGALESGEHGIERRSQRAQLVGGTLVGDAATRKRMRDGRRIVGHAAKRPEALPSRPHRGHRAEQHDDQPCGPECARHLSGDRRGGLGRERRLEEPEPAAVGVQDRGRQYAVRAAVQCRVREARRCLGRFGGGEVAR